MQRDLQYLDQDAGRVRSDRLAVWSLLLMKQSRMPEVQGFYNELP